MTPPTNRLLDLHDRLFLVGLAAMVAVGLFALCRGVLLSNEMDVYIGLIIIVLALRYSIKWRTIALLKSHGSLNVGEEKQVKAILGTFFGRSQQPPGDAIIGAETSNTADLDHSNTATTNAERSNGTPDVEERG